MISFGLKKKFAYILGDRINKIIPIEEEDLLKLNLNNLYNKIINKDEKIKLIACLKLKTTDFEEFLWKIYSKVAKNVWWTLKWLVSLIK